MKHPDYIDTVFCERLNKLVISAQMVQKKTIAELASELDINVGTLNGYRYGRALPTVESLLKLADYFGVSTDYLLGREGYELEDNK